MLNIVSDAHDGHAYGLLWLFIEFSAVSLCILLGLMSFWLEHRFFLMFRGPMRLQAYCNPSYCLLRCLET